jgi:hypothetical protein
VVAAVLFVNTRRSCTAAAGPICPCPLQCSAAGGCRARARCWPRPTPPSPPPPCGAHTMACIMQQPEREHGGEAEWHR